MAGYATLGAMPEPVRGVAQLVTGMAEGCRVKFLFFWGHHPDRDGGIGVGCLSQWWPSPFTVDGARFATAEHYMMWRKSLLFDDSAIAEQILAAPHPHAAKALGRRVAGFDEQVWDEHRFSFVVACAGEQTAVWAEHYCPYPVRVAGEGLADGLADGLAGGWVPQPHGSVVACAGEQTPVRAERHCADWLTEAPAPMRFGGPQAVVRSCRV